MKILKKEIKVTNHFVERYYERIFRETPPRMAGRSLGFKMKKINKVIDDIAIKISSRDMSNLLFLKNCKHARLPFENNQIILKEGALVTILN